MLAGWTIGLRLKLPLAPLGAPLAEAVEVPVNCASRVKANVVLAALRVQTSRTVGVAESAIGQLEPKRSLPKARASASCTRPHPVTRS